MSKVEVDRQELSTILGLLLYFFEDLNGYDYILPEDKPIIIQARQLLDSLDTEEYADDLANNDRSI